MRLDFIMRLKVVDGDYIIRDSIVDGVGLRNVLFLQGCAHHCKGCHNPQTHNFEAGVYKEVEELADELLKDSITKNVTISGGDPMYQPQELAELLKILKARGCDIWVYTGFTFYELKGEQLEVLKYTDMLVEGKFIEEQKTMSKLYRGSSNQNIIDVQASLKGSSLVYQFT